jgi:hypothetical protein
MGFASTRTSALVACPFGLVQSINSVAVDPPTPVVISHVHRLQGSLARSLVCMVACSSCRPPARTLLLRHAACVLPHLPACYCCHARRPSPACYYDTHAPVAASSSLLMLAGTVVPAGTTSACAHFPHLLMEHLQHTSKQMKHLEHALATYVYSHYNICSIQIKHL